MAISTNALKYGFLDLILAIVPFALGFPLGNAFIGTVLTAICLGLFGKGMGLFESHDTSITCAGFAFIGIIIASLWTLIIPFFGGFFFLFCIVYAIIGAILTVIVYLFKKHFIKKDDIFQVNSSTNTNVKYIKCPFCGMNIKENSQFCSKCGKTIPKSISTNKITCSKCGAELDKKSEFCSKCGNKLEVPSTNVSDKRDTTSFSNVENTKKVESKIFCTECGVELTPDNDFCDNCGSKVDD